MAESLLQVKTATLEFSGSLSESSFKKYSRKTYRLRISLNAFRHYNKKESQAFLTPAYLVIHSDIKAYTSRNRVVLIPKEPHFISLKKTTMSV